MFRGALKDWWLAVHDAEGLEDSALRAPGRVQMSAEALKPSFERTAHLRKRRSARSAAKSRSSS